MLRYLLHSYALWLDFGNLLKHEQNFLDYNYFDNNHQVLKTCQNLIKHLHDGFYLQKGTFVQIIVAKINKTPNITQKLYKTQLKI